MTGKAPEQAIQAIEIVRDIEIAASIDIVFETVLEQLGPFGEEPDESPMPLKLEAWPGGRWYRDLGNNTGQFWGFVQSIVPYHLLEIHGPMFMSSPAISHVLFRLKEENGVTYIQFSHRAIGQIPPEHIDGVEAIKGWNNFFTKAGNRVRLKLAKGA
ncbi:MAG TPA: SRPBCC domain-containing protein [Pseudacidobacterium sp.]|jgi:hypothetical protein|nr:SRPBCC domain-containing protein [Pseudacidobacterium sp.]